MSVTTPMIGEWLVHLDAIRPFSIHGDQYLELHVRRVDDATNQSLAVRVPQHALEGATLTVGDQVKLTFLMGQITSAKKVAQ